MKKNSWHLLALLGGLSLLAASCELPNGARAGHGRVQIEIKSRGQLTGDLSFIKSAVITVVGVEARMINGGWLRFPQQGFSIDLMALDGRLNRLIGRAQLPDGDYDSLRLVTEDNGVATMTDGSQVPLVIPSGAHSGLKIFFESPLHVDALSFGRVEIELDIERSFVATAKSLHFKPVLHAETSEIPEPVLPPEAEGGSGNVEGTVEDTNTETLDWNDPANWDTFPIVDSIVGV